ncbi:MAG TPA: uroporphyrinogen-III synthase [Stenotrophomonas sp.]|nr:uroporphyrinogen-III synthase [Stenotrophomonas sp.]
MADPAHVPATLISLRPAAQHDSLRHGARRLGMDLIAVSPWRLRALEDEATRTALDAALDAPVVVFTSPMAVRAAVRLWPARAPAAAAENQWLAVGEGTALALRRAGVQTVRTPARMDSEGLLALPALAAAAHVGLVTAPGGRGLLAAELHRRGTALVRADVYERVPLPLSAALLARLRALHGPTVLAISSAEALERVLVQLPEDVLARWREQPAVVASARLGELAREHGFVRVVRAEGPRPRQLLAAASAAGKG